MDSCRVQTGKLLVFEGPDGVGKSELSRTLAARLNAIGIHSLYLTFPGKEEGTLGKAVYDIHHDPKSFGIKGLNPTSRQMLHIAAHIDSIEQKILPALRKGTWVVLDRYWWSTWVYGLSDGVNEKTLAAMIDMERPYWEDVKPEKVFLITRDKPFREEHSPSKWNELKEYYNSLAEVEEASHPITLLRNDSTIDEVLHEILTDIEPATKAFKLLHDANENIDDSVQSTFSLFSPPSSSPKLVTRIFPARPTIVFDAYWRFAAERQQIFFRRFDGCPPPWTADTTLAHHKFTNAYRASDRTSQYLIRRVIYEGDQTPKEVFFRILVFKIFNKIATWELLRQKLGQISYADYSFKRYDSVLSESLKEGKSIYSAAYIMPSGKTQFGHPKKHRNNLKLIEKMMEDELGERITEKNSMQEVFDIIRSYPTIGDFLAYQFVTDINYSELTNFSEMQFVVPGPGARDGISKCFNDLGGLNEVEIIKLTADRQESEFERLGIAFRSLWGRPLQLIDCQSLFCEVDKYARLEYPEVRGKSKRTRIKQKFRANDEPIDYWYPPKWGINKLIKASAEKL